MSDIIKSLTGQIEKGSRTSNNYNNFENKPQINGITLEGNKSSEQLGINSTTVKFNDGESFQEKYNNGELRGEKGDTGLQGPKGEKGDTGEPGKGIPTGGTIGQILAKKSNDNYDTEWADQNKITEEEIKNAVDDYFQKNPIKPTPIDKTLTKSDEAADSKIVGDKFNETTNNVNTLNNILELANSNPNITWQGFFYISNGKKFSIGTTSASVCILSNPIKLNKNDKIVVNTQQTNGRDAISITDKEQSYYLQAVPADDGSKIKTYEYTAIEDCYVVVSCYANNKEGIQTPANGFEVKIEAGSSQTINEINAEITNLNKLKSPNYFGVTNGGTLNTIITENPINKRSATLELLFSKTKEETNKWFYGGASTYMFALYHTNDDKLRISLKINANTKQVDVQYKENEFIHVVITFNADTRTKIVYVNGVEVARNTEDNITIIELRDEITTQGVTLYQKRIWTRVLTEDEVKNIYNFGYPTKYNLKEQEKKDLYTELTSQGIKATEWINVVQNKNVTFTDGFSLVNNDDFNYFEQIKENTDKLSSLTDVIQNNIHADFQILNVQRGAHDCTFIEDRMFSFNKPSDGHTVILTGEGEDLTFSKRLQINFTEPATNRELEMKSCDYKFGKLLVGNGRAIKYDETDYTQQGAKLYVFREVLDWESKPPITFDNGGKYDVIDVSSLGYKVYGFWGGFDDLVYVSCNLFNDIYLIQLAKGSNQFSQGAFVSADSDRYNGSFEILGHWHQDGGLGEWSGHGGQYYKGNLYIATNDNSQCRIYKCILNNNGKLQFEAIDFNVLDETNTKFLKYRYIDGLCIKNDILYAQPLNSGSSPATKFEDFIVSNI